MRLYSDDSRIFKNARFVLEKIAEIKRGDSIVAVVDSGCYQNGRALCDVAKQMGANGIIVDIDMYGGDERYMKLPVMEPLRQAILRSDVTFMLTDQMLTDFGRFLGDRDECDTALLGHNKRFTFESTGMEQWNLNEEEVLNNRKRALNLHEFLKTAKRIHITTKKGTDLVCDIGTKLDAMYPVMAIIPFYSEVAVIPAAGTVNGVVVADGASEFAYGQRGFPIRPAFPGHQELYKEPLKLIFKDSLLVGFEGDSVQMQRLQKLLDTVDPVPDLCDEIGLVTTTSRENDQFGWRIDGSHQTHCVHVAIGNNHTRRGEIIHAPEHVDFDVHDPTIAIDGKVIYSNGIFHDELLSE